MIAMFLRAGRSKRAAAVAAAGAIDLVDAMSRGFPVPPMPAALPAQRPRDAQIPKETPMPEFRTRSPVSRDLSNHVQEAHYRVLPRGEGADRAALSRPPPAQPPCGRPGEVHRLRAVRLGLPGRRDLRRGRRQHRGGALLPGRTLRPRLPDQLPALHRLRPVHRGLPDPGADDDQRVRDSPTTTAPTSSTRRTSCWRPCSRA